MNKKKIIATCVTSLLLILVVVFSILVAKIDRQEYGVHGETVGFATINFKFYKQFSYNLTCEDLSKYLGLGPFIIVGLYALIGLNQLLKTRSLKKVDKNIYLLAVIYLLLLILYIVFLKFSINTRPKQEASGIYELSYPSSHTMLAVVICGTSFIINNEMYKNKYLFAGKNVYWACQIGVIFLGVLIVLFRTISGVHWLTDIIGGVLFGALIVSLYYLLINLDFGLLKKAPTTVEKKENQEA